MKLIYGTIVVEGKDRVGKEDKVKILLHASFRYYLLLLERG